MIIKKEDHNTGGSDGIETFLVDNLIKNLKIDALSCLKSTLSKKKL